MKEISAVFPSKDAKLMLYMEKKFQLIATTRIVLYTRNGNMIVKKGV
jgi:hypothetical protein